MMRSHWCFETVSLALERASDMFQHYSNLQRFPLGDSRSSGCTDGDLGIGWLKRRWV